MSEAKKETELKHNCDNHEKCMEMIQAVLDGSATEEEVQHFKSNMDVCMPCIDSYNLEKSIKDSLKLKVEKKCCPESTIARIKASLGFATLAIGMIILEVKLVELFF